MAFYDYESTPIHPVVPSDGVTRYVPVVIGAMLVIPNETVSYDEDNTDSTFTGYLSGRLKGVAADDSEFAVGDAVYWDADNKCVTATADDNRLMGVALSAKESTDATANVRIYPLMVV